jgi:hypothetical protein
MPDKKRRLLYFLVIFFTVIIVGGWLFLFVNNLKNSGNTGLINTNFFQSSLDKAKEQLKSNAPVINNQSTTTAIINNDELNNLKNEIKKQLNLNN